jgi:hypothetical protein
MLFGCIHRTYHESNDYKQTQNHSWESISRIALKLKNKTCWVMGAPSYATTTLTPIWYENFLASSWIWNKRKARKSQHYNSLQVRIWLRKKGTREADLHGQLPGAGEDERERVRSPHPPHCGLAEGSPFMMPLMMGKQKAEVFPDPVCAHSMRSLPASKIGMAWQERRALVRDALGSWRHRWDLTLGSRWVWRPHLSAPG